MYNNDDGQGRFAPPSKYQVAEEAWQMFLIERALEAKAIYQVKAAAAGTLAQLGMSLKRATSLDDRTALLAGFAERTAESIDAFHVYEAEWVEALRVHHRGAPGDGRPLSS